MREKAIKKRRNRKDQKQRRTVGGRDRQMPKKRYRSSCQKNKTRRRRKRNYHLEENQKLDSNVAHQQAILRILKSTWLHSSHTYLRGEQQKSPICIRWIWLIIITMCENIGVALLLAVLLSLYKSEPTFEETLLNSPHEEFMRIYLSSRKSFNSQ